MSGNQSFTFGGDEVGAVVVDIGHGLTKAGYAGEDTPKCVFPSSVAYTVEGSSAGGDAMDVDGGDKKQQGRKFYVGTSAMATRRDNAEATNPFKQGVIDDWEVVEALWDHAWREQLKIDPSQHPLMFCEPSTTTSAQRERAAELMFEKFQFPAAFMQRNAVLSAFAAGRTTSLVLDVGAGQTTAVPVHDGYTLTKGIVKTPIGGDVLTSILSAQLTKAGHTVHPRYSIKRSETAPGKLSATVVEFPNTTASFNEYARLDVVRDIKDAICRVNTDPLQPLSVNASQNVSYELPDGNVINFSNDRVSVPEALFTPSLAKATLGDACTVPDDALGIHRVCFDAITKCDTDIRKDLYSSIIVTGGTTFLPGLGDRLYNELLGLAPQAFQAKVKLVLSGGATQSSHMSMERRFSSWIGGSILASLGSFQQLWLSKKEYEEAGSASALIDRKCP